MKWMWVTVALLIAACASFSDIVIPELPNRTLRISRTVVGFEYQYEICTRHFLGACTKTEMHVDTYDLNNPTTREQLINMGFVLLVPAKVLP